MIAVVAIGGPTASGKTALALDLCARLGGEVVNADSVQVYQEFDVGSCKPTLVERARVRHHMVDVQRPDAPLDAAAYACMADARILEIASRGRLPVVVGGTGLWMRALLRGLVRVPTIEPQLRRQLRKELREQGRDTTFARLAALDPAGARALHPNDTVRVLRALEVVLQTGKRLSDMQREHQLGAPKYRHFMVALEPELQALHDRIAGRTQQMLQAGLIDECKVLLNRWGSHVRPFGSVGYRQVASYLTSGTIGGAEALQASINLATRQCAKQQRTWFSGESLVSMRIGQPYPLSAVVRHDLYDRCAALLD